MSTLIGHIESHLGEMDGGWQGSKSIQVLRFSSKPGQGRATYVTLGLSKEVVTSGGAEPPFRQEVLISVHDRFDAQKVTAFLLSFAEYLETTKRGLVHGMAIGPSAPLIEGVSASAVYASTPVFFEEEFEVHTGSFPPTVFVSLLALHRDDVTYIQAHGSEAFDDRLSANIVDLFDLNRPPVGE